MVLFVWAGLAGVAAASPGDEAQVREVLRLRLESAGLPAQLSAAGEAILATSALPEFYVRRVYQPAWSRQGQPSAAAEAMLAAIEDSRLQGLEPEHYHRTAIHSTRAALRDETLDAERRLLLLADFDLLLTDAFLMLASHYQQGRINPETIDPEWRARRGGADPLPVLETALLSGQIGATLEGLLPQAPEYAGLRAALLEYRARAARGEWPQVPAGPTLRPGQSQERVPLLRARLHAGGDLSEVLAEEANSEFFDADLVAAVRAFQSRHGLNPDGVVGPATLAALNVPLAERVRQIEINLERWRWLPRDLGDRYILVNIAAFQVELVEQGRSVLDMRAVVGRLYRRTPVFSGSMTYLVLNPNWQVPHKLAVEDILPQVQKDPGYLSRQGFRVFRGWGSEAIEINPAEVDWKRLTKRSFPYNLRQEPGPANALGRIKFMFPNPHDVYLHDTPARELFRKESRAFSSGCIRIEKPMELALRLLAGTPLGEPEALAAALERPGPRTVRLPQAVPVHLLYWTAWVDGEGRLQLRPDVYERDELLGQALQEAPPQPTRTTS